MGAQRGSHFLPSNLQFIHLLNPMLMQSSSRANHVAAVFMLSLSLLSGCASNPYKPYVVTPLTSEQRQAAFDKVVETIAKQYVDAQHNGVDWTSVAAQYRSRVLEAKDDATFWRELNRMTGTLKDAHTQVLTPLEANGKPMQRGNYGLNIARIDGQLVVKDVATNSQARLLGVRPGDLLRTIDNESAETWWQRTGTEVRGSSTDRSNFSLIRRELNTRPVGSELHLGLQSGNGSYYSVTLKQDPIQPNGVRSHLLTSNIGYVSFRNFDLSLMKDLDFHLKRTANARGLILDLRGNPGGAMKMTTELLAYFVEPGVVGTVITRDNKPVTALLGLINVTPTLEVKAKPDQPRLNMPMAVLIDENTASAAELTSAVLKEKWRALIFGSSSCGCLLGVRGGGTSLPGGGKLYYSELDMRIGKSSRVEGVGIQPDQVIVPTVSSLTTSRDLTFEAAHAWLLNAITEKIKVAQPTQ
jgi:carboxyl-terminal processing protease